MQRREFMKITGSVFLTGFVSKSFAATAQQSKPNILFILADDLGYGDLGCYGQETIKTPNIDKLAQDGLRFTQHYAGSTVCAPSRACLLTGQHTGHVHVRGNGEVMLRQNPDDITIAEVLKNAGYTTAMIGKSSVGCRATPELSNEKGFDHFFGYISHGDAHHYFPEVLYRNGEEIRYPENKLHEGTAYSQDLFLEDTLRYLEEERDKPFFLHLSLQIPHASLCAPEDWKTKYRGQFAEELTMQNHYRSEPEPRTTFAAMISRMDHDIGVIIEKLKALGLDSNTLVIFTSDNGAMNEGGHDRSFFNSSGPLRGGKRDMYEGGIRVPFIAWWPGRIAPGTTTDHPAAFWDFPATACELTDTQMPGNTDGISYLPTLLGRTDAQQTHEYLYWEFHEQGGKRAVRFDNWKAVQTGMSKRPFDAIELYDLSSDLAEEHNVAAEHPDIVERAEAYFAQARTECEYEKFNFPL
jgi:arylsulfatase A